MKLFARKPSTDPSLPPELQPYYGKPGRWAWWHQMSTRSRGVLLLAAALVIVLVALLFWVATRDTSSTSRAGGGNPAASQSPQTNKSLNGDKGKPATTPLSSGTSNAKPAE